MDVTDGLADATRLEFLYSKIDSLKPSDKRKKNFAYGYYSHIKLSISHLVRVIRYRAVLESNFHSSRNVRSQITA